MRARSARKPRLEGRIAAEDEAAHAGFRRLHIVLQTPFGFHHLIGVAHPGLGVALIGGKAESKEGDDRQHKKQRHREPAAPDD